MILGGRAHRLAEQDQILVRHPPRLYRDQFALLMVAQASQRAPGSMTDPHQYDEEQMAHASIRLDCSKRQPKVHRRHSIDSMEDLLEGGSADGLPNTSLADTRLDCETAPAKATNDHRRAPPVVWRRNRARTWQLWTSRTARSSCQPFPSPLLATPGARTTQRLQRGSIQSHAGFSLAPHQIR